MTEEQDYRCFRDYCQMKYGSVYTSAILKLQAPYSEAYDEKGFLKPEYSLTPLEKEAVLTILSEFAKPRSYRIR